MSENFIGVDLAKPDDPGFIEVIVLDYANGNAWVYRFSGDMTWEDMEEWLEKNTDFKPTQCEWLIGRKNEKLHVYQALPFPIRKDTKLNSSHSVFR